jgi:hypothetical protein
MDKNTPPLDLYIRDEMEKWITVLPHVLNGHHGDKIEVAGVNIAYKNREIIRLLRERGTVITNAKFDKLDDIDKKIANCLGAPANESWPDYIQRKLLEVTGGATDYKSDNNKF